MVWSAGERDFSHTLAGVGEEDTLIQDLGRSRSPRRRGRAFLTILSGHEVGRTHKLSAAETVIGRGSDVDIQIVDDGVSRRHAKFVREPDGTMKLVDLESTNGTYVNGRRIDIEALREGDRLRIGQSAAIDFRYEYEDGDDSPGRKRTGEQAIAGAPGEARDDQRDLDKALKAYRRTLAVREQNLGPNHPSVASLLDNIGSVLRAQGDFAGALRHHERGLSIYRARVGDGGAPPEMAHMLANIGECHLGLQDHDKALETLERALAAMEARRADDRELAHVRYAIARALRHSGREPVRSRSLARLAQEGFGQDPRSAERVAEIDRWLAEAD